MPTKKIKTEKTPQLNNQITNTKVNFDSHTGAETIIKAINNHLKYTLAKDQFSATQRDIYKSVVYTVRDCLIDKWINTQQTYYKKDVKRIYYISMEFLLGRLLGDALGNLGIYDIMGKALDEMGYNLDEIRELEEDAALGNGGLGRLAACFLESMSTLEIPGNGYGIRYDYGIFSQKIENGFQVESPDSWLRYGNPWEIERPEYIYAIKFYGQVHQYMDKQGIFRNDWVDTEDIIAMPYDTPVSGYRNNTVNNLRLWAAKSTREFNLQYFNSGDYERAVEDKIESETISKVLYPRDDYYAGKELRLKQEYFLVSATLQDILRRFKKTNEKFESFPDKVAIQLNDTHPALAIPELMRLLIDFEDLSWENAWSITTKTFGYTNHTVMPEALERWPVDLVQKLLPRHLQIIYEINRRFLEDVVARYHGDIEKLNRMSVVEEGVPKKVRMANLAIIGSHSLNGVAELHTKILKESVFKDFYELMPEKFNNKTNGITQRRWLLLSNPGLAALITKTIGDEWITNLSAIKALEKYADDKKFLQEWTMVKKHNKEKLAQYVKEKCNIELDINSIFDCHIKRFHEYKRQLLNVLHIIAMYLQIKQNPKSDIVPRTFIFAGKAAPAYNMAKLIIKLINNLAKVINNDPDINDKIKVLFLANYSVSLAQKIIPAADVSEQISTAGMEASGTGNMKFALNGALTIGTLDGANIEILQEVGEKNIFIFGLKAEEVVNMRQSGYYPDSFYEEIDQLKPVLDMIMNNYFSIHEFNVFMPIINSLLENGDYYMVLADFEDYVKCQKKVNLSYKNYNNWQKMCITNVANCSKFSSDRTINEYAEEIWKTKSLKIG
jgi:glycogen phosphorylase